MRGAVAGASTARHATELARPVRGGVGQLDAVAASQPAAMADGCVAQHVGQVAGKRGKLLVHNSMLKPSRSIKMLTFMLLAAVGATAAHQAHHCDEAAKSASGAANRSEERLLREVLHPRLPPLPLPRRLRLCRALQMPVTVRRQRLRPR